MNIQKFWMDLFEFNNIFTLNDDIMEKSLKRGENSKLSIPNEYIEDGTYNLFKNIFNNTESKSFVVRFRKLVVHFKIIDYVSEDNNDFVILIVSHIQRLIHET